MSEREKVLKGNAFETCVRVLRLVAAELVREAMQGAGQGASATCSAAVELVGNLFDISTDRRLRERAEHGGADCLRVRAFLIFVFALFDYMEGGEH